MQAESPKKRRRPFGISVIIVILALLVLNSAADVYRVLNGMPPHTLPDLPAPAILLLDLFISAGCAALAFGLWRMLDWAWYATMIACGAAMAYSIWRHLDGGDPYLTMLLLVILVFYLNQREVKAVFARVHNAEVTS